MSIEELLECGRNWGILYVGTGILPVCDLDSIFQKVRLRVPFPDHVCLQTETPGQEVRQQRQDRRDQGTTEEEGFDDKSSAMERTSETILQPLQLRNTAGGALPVCALHHGKPLIRISDIWQNLKVPLVILPVCLVSAFLLLTAPSCSWRAAWMIAHVYAVSLEMALIAIVLILTIAIPLYYGFKPGDSYPMVLTPLAFLFKIPYVVPLLVGLRKPGIRDSRRMRRVPVLPAHICEVRMRASWLPATAPWILYRNAARFLNPCSLTSDHDGHVITPARWASSWCISYAGCPWITHGWLPLWQEPWRSFWLYCGDFVFGVSVPVGPDDSGLVLSAAIAAVFNFLSWSCGLYPDRICAVRGR